MKADISKKLIFCNKCQKWIKAGTETLLIDGGRGRILHLEDDEVVGYSWDYEWGEMFPSFKNDADYD